MRDSTSEISGDGYRRTYTTGNSGNPPTQHRPFMPLGDLIGEKLLGEKKVFFEQQVTGELLQAARTNVIDDIAYQTLLKFFEERGLSEEDLRRRRVTIKYSVEPV